MFNKKIHFEKFNTSNKLPHKIKITNIEIRNYIVTKFNQTYNNYYNLIFTNDEDIYESDFKINDNANLYYIGNLTIHDNLISPLFLITDTDDNNTNYMLLYNFKRNQIKSIIVMAEQFNSFENTGNETYFHKDNFFIQLSNFSRVENESITNYFPKSFLKKVKIKNITNTLEYYSLFIVNEEGHLKFINITN